MSVELQIKSITLADEARTIRRKERAAKRRGDTDQIERLLHHRRHVVRPEARHTHLARAFISGRAYSTVEMTCRTTPDPARIATMVAKYGKPEHKNLTSADRSAGIVDWLAMK